jgi:PucR C-terminal helix-turn-helix domain/GGDEF-like domain
MPISRVHALIREWGMQFQGNPLAAGVVARLRDRTNEIWQHTFQLLQRENPKNRNLADETFTQEAKAHCRDILEAIIAIANGRVDKSNTDPFSFVRTHAEWRARHQAPMIASLHVYRLASRTYSEMSRDLLLQDGMPEEIVHSLTVITDFWIQFFDHIAAVFVDSYALEEGRIAAQGARSYLGLINDILRGAEPSDPESQQLLALRGIRPGAPMAVAIAKPHRLENIDRVDIEVSLRSLVRLFEQALPPTIFGRLVEIRNNEVTVIASSDSDTGRGVLQALHRGEIAGRLENGHSARVGVSLEVVEFARFAQALEEAEVALGFTSTARPFVHFSDIDLPELLVRRANRAAVRLIPEWARHFNSAEDDQSRELTRTIRVFADCSFNVKHTARCLGLHTNTVYFRLNRIRKLTGIDPRTYSGTSLVLTVMRILEVHGGAQE